MSTITPSSLPHAFSEEDEIKDLTTALNDLGEQLVLEASDNCRVLPHILHLIGKGGEHLVFKDIRFPNYVFKIDFINSLNVLYAYAKNQDKVVEAIEKLYVKAESYNNRLHRLYKYFDPGSVPLEIASIKTVPLNKELVLSIMKDRHIDIPKKIVVPPSMPVLSSIQRKIVLPVNKFSLYSSYAELNRTISLDSYIEGHNLLAFGEGIGSQNQQIRQDIILKIYPSLKKISDLIQEDHQFKILLGRLIQKTIKYSVQYNELIDMVGGGNVLFFKAKNQTWKYFLMDVLSPPEVNFNLIQTIALLVKHDQKVSLKMKANVLNVINYIRFSNALAILTGIKERIHVSNIQDLTAKQWHENLIIEKYLDIYTPKKKK